MCDGVALCCLGARVSSHIACSGCGECCERRMDPVCEVVEVDVFWMSSFGTALEIGF